VEHAAALDRPLAHPDDRASGGQTGSGGLVQGAEPLLGVLGGRRPPEAGVLMYYVFVFVNPKYKN